MSIVRFSESTFYLFFFGHPARVMQYRWYNSVLLYLSKTELRIASSVDTLLHYSPFPKTVTVPFFLCTSSGFWHSASSACASRI